MKRTFQQDPKSTPAATTWRGLRVSHPSDQHEHEADRFGEASKATAPATQARAPWATGRPQPAAGNAGSGSALPATMRADFGARLGHSLVNVRVHHDAEADLATRSLAASAFTVGNDIYFRAGRYAPQTEEGRHLLGHELLHVRQQQTAGLRVDRKVFTPAELEDMNPPSTSPQAGLLGSDPAFEKFAGILRTKYHAQTVRRGTYKDQAEEVATARVSLPSGVNRGTLDQSTWKEWSPPSGWATYKAILDSIEAFARDFGGLPEIREVLLYNVLYQVNEQTGLIEPASTTGASYGNGQLNIYAEVAHASSLPAGRSGVPYAGQQANLVPVSSERQAIERNITHELGHGVAEMAVGPGKTGPDPGMLDDFRREAGWAPYRAATGTSPAVPERLVDSGVAAVRDALRTQAEPPADQHITKYNWNEGRWIEQPISEYATENPSEDFAESIMAFLKLPEVLKKRSPARFKFIENRKDRWLPKQKTAAPQTPSTTGSTINTPMR
jgi:Domain of unknown function (DUF4157)